MELEMIRLYWPGRIERKKWMHTHTCTLNSSGQPHSKSTRRNSQYYKYRNWTDWGSWQNVGRLRDTWRTDVYQLDARKPKKNQFTKPNTIYIRYFCYNHKIYKNITPLTKKSCGKLLFFFFWCGLFYGRVNTKNCAASNGQITQVVVVV